MTAASSPNEAGDQTGGLNKVFGYVYQIRIKAKALKAKNRQLYYFLKWFIMLGLFFLIFIRIAVKPRGLARGYKAAIR